MARDWRSGRDPDAGRLSLIRRLVRSWRHRVAVVGHSMEPGLREGDWLLVDPDARPGLGDVVAATDPRESRFLLVKRVVDTETGGRVLLGSDNPAHAGQRIGPIDASKVVGRAWFRYWPLTRLGRV